MQSALLHSCLLLCLAAYHWHSDGSLNFSANSLNEKVTGHLTILSDHNTLVVEMFFEKPEETGSHKIAENITDATLNANVGTKEAAKENITSDITAEVAARAVPESSALEQTTEDEISLRVQRVTTVSSEKIKNTKIEEGVRLQIRQATAPERPVAKSLAQYVAAQPSTRTVAPPTARVSISANHVAVKPLQAARPDHAHSPKPVYPLALRDLGVSGVVWLRVWVDNSGLPIEIELAKGSGYRLFDEAALRAVQHWRFIPAKNEQQSLASWVEFAVRFEING